MLERRGGKTTKYRRERQTDGKRDRGQRTEGQSSQVGMKNGFRRGGGGGGESSAVS